MSLNFDQDYLKNDQYQRPNNLDARIQIHQRFSRNTFGWNRWVYDRLNLRSGMRVLELGCGMGFLWRENTSRIPRGIQVVLSDYSPGMLAETRHHLRGDERFSFIELDAQAIPLVSSRFDLVIANHMLYHVPDISRALSEIERVLRPQGHLAAATNGVDHMSELYDLARRLDSRIRQDDNNASRFGLQNGDMLLAPFFPNRELFFYDDALWITESQPLVNYIVSMWGIWGMGKWNAEWESRIETLIRTQIEDKGGVFIHKSTGLFWARRH